MTRNPGLAKGFWKLPEVTAQKIRDGWLHRRPDAPGRRRLLLLRRPQGRHDQRGRREPLPEGGRGRPPPPPGPQGRLRRPRAPRDQGRGAGGLRRRPRPGAPPDEEAVKRFFLERGAPYAHPRRVFFLDRLPLGGTGKLDRTALKRQAATLPPIESQR